METLPSTKAPTLNSTTSLTQLPASVARDQNPAAVYLARLAPGSRRAMRAALETLARIADGPAAAAETFPVGRASISAHSGPENGFGRQVRPVYGESSAFGAERRSARSVALGSDDGRGLQAGG
jgi:hypothetical protein